MEHRRCALTSSEKLWAYPMQKLCVLTSSDKRWACQMQKMCRLTSSELVKWAPARLTSSELVKACQMLWACQACQLSTLWALSSVDKLELVKSAGAKTIFGRLLAELEPRLTSLSLSTGANLNRDIDFVPFDKLRACQMLWVLSSGAVNSELWALNSELWNDGENLIGNIKRLETKE